MTPLVQAALEALNMRVNVFAGATHPLDDSIKKSVFKWLKDQGETIDQDEINEWALNNDWSDRHAVELGKLAQKIGEGARVQIKYPDRVSEEFFNRIRVKASST
ncbi:MAG: hypothetical protein LBV35_02150 [Acinetobacter sp.]|jgi:ABC-type uncharacterized transport system substrate-binding protein|uniref:DUF1889 family protein n=1 Tax=Acinetobacter sp. TaxID=472 RepID=UPI00284CD160|nr:DUF1889 family protein [Acinetobacter sp.]MDR3027241.1 hypothetical protein [Acinetobacter sp.]